MLKLLSSPALPTKSQPPPILMLIVITPIVFFWKVRAVEEILKQTEEDADKEILELKTKYEKLLRTEREANVRMRGESGIIKKKLQTLVRKIG